MAEREDTLQALAVARDPETRRQRCAELVRRAREGAEAALNEGQAPVELVRGLAERFDQVVGALFLSAEVGAGVMASLVALGGYGRGELYPHSDLDLLILHQGHEEALATHLVEQVVYPLWDAGVSVGHAVRDIDQTLTQAAQDLTMRTSLLDLRLIAGDEGPFHALQAGATREFFGPQRVHSFVEALREERASRHRRFGETEYLLEPNVKNSKGALRDLNTGLWAAKARFGVTELTQLVDHGGASPRQVKGLEQALRFLRELRLRMHLQAGRAQDHLQFELQEALAPQMFPGVEVPGAGRRAPAVAPAVERLMHAFYRHARTVVMETDGLLERCGRGTTQPAQPGPALTADPNEHFRIRDRRIMSSEPQRFWDEPAEMLRAYQLAIEQGLALDRETRDVISEAVADQPGASLVADEVAAGRFMELLCAQEEAQEGTVFEEMHHQGLISALIPEFEPCTGRIQHDLYHVYTVDMHSLYVLALLRTWRRGELRDVYPTPVEVMARVERPETLLLAALLHDVAKPLGHGHARRGARLALGVAARMGLDAAQQQEIGLLVGDHLTMAHLSQRRDLSDPEVIAGFAGRVGDVERLRKLYLLTVADTAMTAPDNLTSWKASLLEELFVKTYAHLRHRPGQGKRSMGQLEARRDALELALRRSWGEVGAVLAARAPVEMLLNLTTDDLTHHLGVAAEMARHPRSVHLLTRPRGDGTELTICCEDAPGLLATITAVMLAHRVEVLSAHAYTLIRADGGPDAHQTSLPLGDVSRCGGGHVVDIFTVKAPEEAGAALWRAFGVDLDRALQGDLSVPEVVRRHTKPSGLKPKVLPQVPIEVQVDNTASAKLTVIDVQAPDRIGVLHAITRALSEQGLVIHLSKVATEAGRVIDNFYVSDVETGGKVTEEARLEALQRGITVAIEALLPDTARLR
jgi:[protein-PII] uridylyltransferase